MVSSLISLKWVAGASDDPYSHTLTLPHHNLNIRVTRRLVSWWVDCNLYDEPKRLTANTDEEAKKEALRVVFNSVQEIARTLHALIGIDT